MRVLVLTSVRSGYASRCLPTLCSSPQIDVVKVVLSTETNPNKKRAFWRKIRKIRKIGLVGALNGLRLRGWYVDKNAEDIAVVAGRYGVPLVETATVNSESTRAIVKETDVDLGLSLGNSYIASSVFSLPKYGMINIHTELLPQFQGAQSIIWPIYEGVDQTGFTIHQIDEYIDTGQILFRKKCPIRFFPTLRETVERNLEMTRSQVPDALRLVCEDYERLKAQAIKQGKGKSYTTPSLWQFLRMLKNHRKMYRRAAKRA
jgi:methionyl-tRNA formyltransferase